MTYVTSIIVLSILVALVRFTLPGHGLSWPGTYEAFAHIWVGVLIVAIFQRSTRWTAAFCLAAITVLEIAMFFWWHG